MDPHTTFLGESPVAVEPCAYLLVVSDNASSTLKLPQSGTIVIGRGLDVVKAGDMFALSTGEDQMICVLPESGPSEALATGDRLLEGFDPSDGLRIGVASCPKDGCDVSTLLARARAASLAAEAGSIQAAETAFTTLKAGDDTIVFADPAMAKLYELG